MMTQTSIDPTEVAKFSRLAESWWDTNGPFKTLHDINPVRLDYIEQTLILKGKNVLEVGCGGGILCEGLAQRGAVVTGLDVDEKVIEIASSHAKQHGGIHYVCQPVEAYEPEGLYDAVVCMEMLEHVPDPFFVIGHCTRLLKPGGYLFLSTINRTLQAYATVIVAAEYLLNLLPRQTHDYDKFIKPSELSAMARATGLSVVQLKGLSYQPMNRQAKLTDSVLSNYLMTCELQKETI